MLEGKEVEGNLGEYGSYHVDVKDTGVVEAGVMVQVDVIAELRKLAKKTSNKLDDGAVDFIEGLLRDNPEESNGQ